MEMDTPPRPDHIPVLKPDEVEELRQVCYGESFYNSADLKRMAQLFSMGMAPDTNLLISGGSSSCCISSAILMLCPDLKHIYVYPKKAVGHRRDTGKKLSGVYGLTDTRDGLGNVAFVDDLIETGSTVKSVFENFISHMLDHLGTSPIPTISRFDIYVGMDCEMGARNVFFELSVKFPNLPINAYMLGHESYMMFKNGKQIV